MKDAQPLSSLRKTILGLSLRDLRVRNSNLLSFFFGGSAFLRITTQYSLIISLTLAGRSLIPYSMLQIMSSVGTLFGAREKLRPLLRRLKTEGSTCNIFLVNL